MTSTICKVTNKFVIVGKVFILAENYSQSHRYAINVGLHNFIGGVDTWWPTCSLQTRKTSVHLWCVKGIHVCLSNYQRVLNGHMFYKTRHSGDRYNRFNHSSGAILCDNHKYFETESEHELWEKWRLQFVEDSPHGYSKCSVCKIFQLNDCMNLGTLWNNTLRYLGIIHYL